MKAIFDVLVANMGQEVAMNELSKRTGSLTIHSQVDSLRQNYQLLIENRTEVHNDGENVVIWSFYKLIGRVVPRVPGA